MCEDYVCSDNLRWGWWWDSRWIAKGGVENAIRSIDQMLPTYHLHYPHMLQMSLVRFWLYYFPPINL